MEADCNRERRVVGRERKHGIRNTPSHFCDIALVIAVCIVVTSAYNPTMMYHMTQAGGLTVERGKVGRETGESKHINRVHQNQVGLVNCANGPSPLNSCNTNYILTGSCTAFKLQNPF